MRICVMIAFAVVMGCSPEVREPTTDGGPRMVAGADEDKSEKTGESRKGSTRSGKSREHSTFKAEPLVSARVSTVQETVLATIK